MKKVLLSVCMAIAAMSVSAQNLTVLSEKTLPMGNKMQVVKDAQGRIFRKLVKPEGYKAAATAPVKEAASDDIVTFYEGFENYRTNFGMDWIPVDWSEINTPENVPTEDQLAHNINMTWLVYESSNLYQDMTTDGTKEAFIHFGYNDDTHGLTSADQDEWLVSPEVTLASNETLHFLLQADYFDVYNINDFDWNTATWPNGRGEAVNTLKIMVTEDDGKNWTEVWDLAKNVTDKLTERECYDASDLKIRPQAVDLSAYAGKTVKVAFRYWRVGVGTGNSMIVDGVTISHPSPAGIDNVKVNGSQSAAAEYFTVNGMRVSNVKPATKGLYIERKNGVARKVVVK